MDKKGSSFKEPILVFMVIFVILVTLFSSLLGKPISNTSVSQGDINSAKSLNVLDYLNLYWNIMTFNPDMNVPWIISLFFLAIPLVMIMLFILILRGV